VATHTQLETAADVSREVSPRTRWAAVLESGFVTGSQPAAIGLVTGSQGGVGGFVGGSQPGVGGFVGGSQPAATGEPRRSRWATVLASNLVDAPSPAGR